ncbi:VWA domain-containing protein [Zhongshania sp. BJYM1]|uniref:VWA domain-containing protein n=1 Tax=Zhongshania aquatica TaxID=2965069 RepID=UPI0022B32D1D|nr:VWA domain-containing protein [Marortus sp. BJYM1]
MDETLLQFIRHLRNNGLAISTAETLDAMRVVATLGYSEPRLLQDGLASCLAKTVDDHERFVDCFDRFFRVQASANVQQELAPQNAGADASDESPADSDEGPGQGDAGGYGQGSGGGGNGGQRDNTFSDVMQAAAEVGLENIQFRTQRGVYRRKMLNALNDEQALSEIQQRQDAGDNEQAHLLTQLRDSRIAAIKEIIDRQLLLNNDAAINSLRETNLKDSSLSAMEHYHRERLPPLIRKLAKKLASRHRQRHKRANRGKLDLGKTLRRNIAYGGIPFHRFWKTTRKDKSEIFVLCDISGSVSAWSRVLLLFVQALSDVLPNTRSFVFCGESIEVTDLFKQYSADDAMAIIQQRHGMGGSDYGAALTSFKDLVEDKLNRRSCVIILGDGRGNGGNTGIDALRSIYHRARLVLWFNPESHYSWNTGDSEIRRYQSACHYVAECGSLRKLERLLDQLLSLLR